MAKKINSELVDEFIKAKIALDKQAIDVALLKKKLIKLSKRGYEHPMLQFAENISYRPPWKKLVDELTKKFMTQGARAVYFNRTLPKRFPKTHGEPKICILAPKYQAVSEKLLLKKKALGLVKESDD